MFVAVSASFPYLLGLGFAALAVIDAVQGGRQNPRGSDLFRTLFLALSLGMLLNLTLVMALSSLRAGLAVGCALSAGGWIVCLRTWVKSGLPRINVAPVVAYGALLTVAGFAVLGDPLQAWDARSAWFFQGKILYLHGALDGSVPWREPSIGFANLAYPKLLPVLAAEVATVAGYWNEYLPKLSIVLIFSGAAAGLGGFLRRDFGSLLLAALPLPLLQTYLWNGYLDGLLALFSVVAALYAARARETSEPMDWLAAASALGVAGSLKYEGVLLLLAVAGALLLLAVRRGIAISSMLPSWHTLALCAPPFLPFLAWQLLERWWGCVDRHRVGAGTVARAWERATDPSSLRLIAGHLWRDAHPDRALALFAVVAFVCWRDRRKPTGLVTVPLVGAAIYGALVLLAYLGTPFVLAWHLQTSADRTMMPPVLLIIAAAATWLGARKFTNSPSEQP